jgi:excisionase family DNA binding protein
MTAIGKKRNEREERICRNVSAQALLLTVHGVAALLACSPRTVYRLNDQGRIPRPVRIGGMIRWPRPRFERWVADGCPPPAGADE